MKTLRKSRTPDRRRALAAALAIWLAPGIAAAVDLLPNGNFESGDFTGWSTSRVNGGRAFIATRGECFSANDTTALDLHGNFAAAIRSNTEGDKDSVGILTSEPFEAGNAIVFYALSENRLGRDDPDPVKLEIRLLDAGRTTLFSQPLHTAVATLSPGCPSAPHYGAMSGHMIDTRAWAGQMVSLQLRQSTNRKGDGFFTLVDDVTIYAPGEVPLLPDAPVAIAGTSLDNAGLVQLDASLSFDPNGNVLTYTWYVDGEAAPRDGDLVAAEDLSPGAHRALLVVSDGIHVATDTLLFVLPETSAPEVVPLTRP